MSLDITIDRWKVVKETEAVSRPTPTIDQYDEICHKFKF